MSTTLNTFLSMLQVQVLQVTLLILIVGLISLLLRNRHPHLVFALWAVVFVKCLTPPVMVSPVGLFAWQSLPSHTQESVEWSPLIGQFSVNEAFLPENPVALEQESTCQTEPAECDSRSQSTCHSTTTQTTNNQPAGSLLAADQRRSSSAGPASLGGWFASAIRWAGSTFQNIRWPLALFLFWLAGVVALLSLAATQWFRCWLAIRRTRVAASSQLMSMVDRVKRQLQFNRPVRLVVTSSGYGPMVFGYFCPVLVLPEQIVNNQSRRELEPVIAHELIHVRRGDTLLCLLQFLAQTFLWFNPLVWWASRQANRVCERCCDLEVVSGLQCKPSEYARTLLGIMELRHSLNSITAAAGIRPVDITANRLRWLVSRRSRSGQSHLWVSWLVATATALLVYPGAGIRGPQEHPEASDTAPTVTNKESLIQLADEAFTEQDWQTSARLYRQIVDANPNAGGAWFRLGYALHALGDLDAAIFAHSKATEFARGRRSALYNWACALCLKGEHDEALAKLSRAIDERLILQRPMEEDPDFASLKDDERFLALVKRHNVMAQKAAESARSDNTPKGPTLGLAMTDEPGRSANPLDLQKQKQLAFWIGQWTITDADGQAAGTSEMTKQNRGHMIKQSWSGRDGKTGESINYFDPQSNSWIHNWVDSDGGVYKLNGTVDDEKHLTMAGNATFPGGDTFPCKMSFKLLDDGRMHHQFMISNDDGETRKIRTEGFYSRATDQTP